MEASLQHTEGMATAKRLLGTAHLDKDKRVEIARNAAVARWGGVMSAEEARQRRAENTRKWREKKKLQDPLAISNQQRA